MRTDTNANAMATITIQPLKLFVYLKIVCSVGNMGECSRLETKIIFGSYGGQLHFDIEPY